MESKDQFPVKEKGQGGWGIVIIIFGGIILYLFFGPPGLIKAPHEFEVEGLSAPAEVSPGGSIPVYATVVNNGWAFWKGEHTVKMSIDGEFYRAENIELSGIGRENKLFSHIVPGKIVGEGKQIEPGDHVISVDGESIRTRVLEPAEFVLTEFYVDPNPAEVMENIRIGVKVTNTGDIEGTHSVIFWIDGREVYSDDVTLGGEKSEVVDFKIRMENKGSYTVRVGDLSKELTVMDSDGGTSFTWIVGIVTAIIIFFIIAYAFGFVGRRRGL
ncbi:hypothetical protein AKJ63_00335 [candidate division MSBL1 archaeon SCGC-AAA259D18]|uniref:CARDB domain-containing protein n=1 Tax=candidate division MSBL1 archaeon SCGC-AAA259D18 TaxID=1698262 RepID=A0A133UCN7_9EURY|nr:hypothetical protein AKJ63_00335 [candidate division MSBL1 archaeon SCGC-AAA259D18]